MNTFRITALTFLLLAALAAQGPASEGSPSSVLTGRVVDARSREPIGAFSISALSWPSVRGVRPRWKFGSPAGSFRVPWPIGNPRLVVEAEGYAPAVLSRPERGNWKVEVVLVRGATIAGRACDSEGRPLAGVRVILLSPRGDPTFLREVKEPRWVCGFIGEESPGLLLHHTYPWEQCLLRATSGADGCWQISHVPPGRFRLAVGGEGLATAVTEVIEAKAEGALQLEDTVLVRPGQIAGMVRSEGQPDAKAVVFARMIGTALDGVRIETGSDGRFISPPLRPGRWRVVVIEREGVLDLDSIFEQAQRIVIVRSGETASVDL